jgi:toxin YoeB
MARQIVWSVPAERDRKDILAYWNERNGSPTYGLKLFGRINTALGRLLKNPFMGRPSDIPDIRVVLVEDPLLFYEVLSDAILVHHICHGKRDLSKLEI